MALASMCVGRRLAMGTMRTAAQLARHSCSCFAYAALSIWGTLDAGCSNDSATPATQPQTMNAGAPAAESAMQPPPTATTPSQANAGSGAAPTMTGAGKPPATNTTPATPAVGGDVPPPRGEAGAGSMPDKPNEPPPTKDCTPVTWANPGKVATVTVKEIPQDAGDKMLPFESIGGLKDYDYEWKEFLFTSTSPAYTSRLMVKKPRDPAKFSGTVFVEWYNVSGGIDFAVLWANSREYFMREGHVFVGVSAQSGGAQALKSMADAKRYAEVNLTNDSIANTVFSQAGAAIRLQTEALLGPCMPVKALIAGGQSQSSARLGPYLNTTQPKDQVFDGMFLHSGAEPASNNPSIPTFVVFTMTEGNGRLMDGPNMVEWMVSGATHNDRRVTERGASELSAVSSVPAIKCANPLNDYPSYRVYNAALDHLHRWVREGKKPPAGMPFEMRGNQLGLDDHMNALGGIRTADIDVPISTHGFDNGPADPGDLVGLLACGLGGEEIPFTPETLMSLYPTHQDYVMKYTAAADKTVQAGFWLKADRDEAVKLAEAAPIPK